MSATVVVGAGVSGRELHARPVSRAVPGRPIVLVDPRLPSGHGTAPHLDALPDHVDLRDAVVHVCTPTDLHVTTLLDVVDRGARRVVLEKPLATTSDDLDRLATCIERTPDVRVRPVAVWPHAAAIDDLRAVVGAATPRQLAEGRMVMVQTKQRRSDSLAGRGGGQDAFDVELPHMVLLAVHLLGPVVELERSSARSAAWMPELPASGGATVRLRHGSGAVSTLVTRLDSSGRRRHVTVAMGRRWRRVHLPVDRHHPWSLTTGPDGTIVRRTESPLDRFFVEAYSLLTGPGPHARPTVSLQEHLHAARTCLQARSLAGRDGSTPS